MAGVRVINGIVFSSMFSDVVEDHQKNTYSRSEGLIISVNGLSGKILEELEYRYQEPFYL